MVREAIESLYTGNCNVIEYEKVKDPVTKITKQVEVTKLTDQPCKLSFSRINAAKGSETASTLTTVVKLFISPDLVIKPGSKIIATQNQRTTAYKSSGDPAVYESHQEIILELFDGWS